MSLTPDMTCLDCIHSTGANCELNRLGYPHVGDWCAAFAVGERPHDKAIQTPESIPSRELRYEDCR